MNSLSQYDFEYPESQVARTPAEKRDHARLFILDRVTSALRADYFYNLPLALKAGDCLVLNNVRVLPVRMAARRRGGGFSEVLITGEAGGVPLTAESAWLPEQGKRYEALISKGRKIHPGTTLSIGETVTVEAIEPLGDGRWIVHVRTSSKSHPVDFFGEFGAMPLPPYIDRKSGEHAALDRERYQTVFAAAGGAVAAPTAGLHFTPVVLGALAERGVEVHQLTLNVSFGTFRPIRDEDYTKHKLDTETYDISAQTSAAVTKAKKEGRRVIAVGTTVTRTLEAATDDQGRLVAGTGASSLFIHPGYAFRMVDGLMTNFHLPRSSLLLLACAFAGRECLLNAYQEAIAQGARLFSYGDAMLML